MDKDAQAEALAKLERAQKDSEQEERQFGVWQQMYEDQLEAQALEELELDGFLPAVVAPPIGAVGPQPVWVAALANQAIATSGDAWQFVKIDGKRYSHLIDPTTGKAVEGRHAATVLAPSAMLADAWASAICVLGPKSGLERLEHEPRAAGLVTTMSADGKVNQIASPAFRKLVKRLPVDR